MGSSERSFCSSKAAVLGMVRRSTHFEVEGEQVGEQRRIAALAELGGHLAEVTVVADAAPIDVEHRKSPSS